MLDSPRDPIFPRFEQLRDLLTACAVGGTKQAEGATKNSKEQTKPLVSRVESHGIWPSGKATRLNTFSFHARSPEPVRNPDVRKFLEKTQNLSPALIARSVRFATSTLRSRSFTVLMITFTLIF
jgi:hypothetical protein